MAMLYVGVFYANTGIDITAIDAFRYRRNVSLSAEFELPSPRVRWGVPRIHRLPEALFFHLT